MDVVQHQILSLDFWQDTVSYEGKNFPSGTIGCDALNIPAALIKQITELCGSLNLFMGAMQLGMANAELFTSARESALQIVHKLKDIPPFSYLDEKQIRQLERTVSGYFDYIEDLIERENTFTMAEFAESINAFLSFRRYDILPDKGRVSAKTARAKAEAEYDEFNKTQKITSDFDRAVAKMLEGGENNE